MKIRPATKDDYDVLFELFSEIQTMHYRTMPEYFKPTVRDEFFFDYFDEVIENKDKHLLLAFDGVVPIPPGQSTFP